MYRRSSLPLGFGQILQTSHEVVHRRMRPQVGRRGRRDPARDPRQVGGGAVRLSAIAEAAPPSITALAATATSAERMIRDIPNSSACSDKTGVSCPGSTRRSRTWRVWGAELSEPSPVTSSDSKCHRTSGRRYRDSFARPEAVRCSRAAARRCRPWCHCETHIRHLRRRRDGNPHRGNRHRHHRHREISGQPHRLSLLPRMHNPFRDTP